MRRRFHLSVALLGGLLAVGASPATAATVTSSASTAATTTISGHVALDSGEAPSTNDYAALARYIDADGEDKRFKIVRTAAIRADGSYSFTVKQNGRYGVAIMTNETDADSTAGYYSTFVRGEDQLAVINANPLAGNFNLEWFLSWRGAEFLVKAPTSIDLGATTLHRGGWIEGKVLCDGKTMDMNGWGVGIEIPGLNKGSRLGGSTDRHTQKSWNVPGGYRTSAVPAGTYTVKAETYGSHCKYDRATARVKVNAGLPSDFSVTEGSISSLHPRPRITGTAKVGHVVEVRTPLLPPGARVLDAFIVQSLIRSGDGLRSYKIRRSDMIHPEIGKKWQVRAIVNLAARGYWDATVTVNRSVLH